jgi:two-component system NtrC family sensor kinase
MRWLRNALSLRARITASFTLIVVGGTVVSTLIGSRIITNALLDQARSRGHQGVEAARTIYADRASDLREHLERTAEAPDVRAAARVGALDAIRTALGRDRDPTPGFVGYVDAVTGRAVYAGRSGVTSPSPGLSAAVRSALEGRSGTSTEVVDETTLHDIDPVLADHAVVPVQGATPDRAVRAGLALFCAVPVIADGRVAGVVFGAALRNQQHEVVDRVAQLLYGAERYRDRQIGTVAILLDEVWVSTNMIRGGERATGTTVPPEVARTLAQGQPWSGRTFVDGEWYEASAAPLTNASGRVVGALYVGILEAPFLAARTEVMLTFLVVCLVGLVIVFILTYLLTRTMIHPLEDMVEATRRIAAGDLDATVKVAARDEIGDLAVAFNHMARSLKTMNRELQEWGHTLEEKVRERSDELVSVQERMARSEKLASVGRLAAGVAHGINNPLGGILSLSMLALEDMPPAHPLHDDLQTIVAQTLRCREIVKGLLDFSRQSDARAVVTEIRPVIESTLALLERQAIFDNIRTRRRLGDGVPRVLIDPGHLQEVVINLVLNAVDAMEENGELTIETAPDPASGDALIRIGDTGKGIPPDAMPLLFEPFFTTKQVGMGTGLGLAIAHGLVTRAGGRIEVASVPGNTVFTIHLPRAAVEVPQAAPEHAVH